MSFTQEVFPMNARMCAGSLILIAAIGFAGGCGKDDQPAAAGSTAAGAARAEAKGTPADTPDAAVLAVVEGLKQNHPEAFWDFLPASYQQDLNELIHLFGEEMDAELWKKSVGVLRKLAKMLKSKKEFLAAGRTQPDGAAASPSSAELATIGELLETLLASDLADLEKLKKADGRKFLESTGGQLLGQLRAAGQDPFAGRLGIFSNLRFKLKESSADSATLTIQETGEPDNDREFVRVEGKWIPRDLRDDWIDNIGQAKARLSFLAPDNLSGLKPQLLELLSAIDRVLDKLAAAQSQSAFAAAMAQAEQSLAPFKSLVAGFVQSAPEEPLENEPSPAGAAPPEANEIVTVIVRGALSDDAQDFLRDKLTAALGENVDPFCDFTGDEESTTFKVGPAGDVKEFAKRLSFLRVTSADAKSRTIMAELKR
jgi:hypothetical protein